MRELKQIGIDLEVNGVIEGNRRSFRETQNDILRRLLLARAPSPAPAQVEGKAQPTPLAPAPAPHHFDPPVPGTRSTGRWTVEFLGQRYAEPNLKGAYRKALLLLAAHYSDFLDKFAAEAGRGRKFVARAPSELYLSSPALARKHAAPLIGGWFFDTNVSTDQVARRVRTAARLCGLRYGPELRLLNNLTEI